MSAGVDAHAAMAGAARALRTEGCVLIEGVLDEGMVARLRDAYLQRYLPGSARPAGGVLVGELRYMQTVDVEPPFDSPEVFAHPMLLALAQDLLGEDCQLSSFGVVVALPGSGPQHAHRDGGPLFASPIERMLPPWAFTLIIPLVDLGGDCGTTRVWPGTHRLDPSSFEARACVDPAVAAGSCLMMDYRLLHAGTPNLGSVPRPILYLVYCRPWFRDHLNFKRQAPLRIDEASLARMDEAQRRLFAAAVVLCRKDGRAD